MGSRRKDAEMLVRLTELAWGKAAQTLAAKTAAERTAGARLAQLRTEIARAEQTAQLSGDLTLRRALDRWTGWADSEARTLNIALARSRAAAARERETAAKALARKTAAAALRDKLVAEARRRKERP